MSHILPLLNEMRGRLGMFIGSPSLLKLAAFLRGYDLAMQKSGQEKADSFLSSFRDWVHRRFQSSSLSWEETILHHCADETEAVKRFWEMLEEFLKETEEGQKLQAKSNGGLVEAKEPLKIHSK